MLLIEIPRTDIKKMLEYRTESNVCHPLHTDPTLHDDESVISVGTLSGIITPISCSDTGLLVGDTVIAAIKGESLFVDLDNMRYPDVAKIINKYVSSQTDYDFKIHPFKWTVDKTEVPGEMSEWNMNTGELINSSGENAWRDDTEKRSKLVSVYVENIMDSVYNVVDNNGKHSVNNMVSEICEMHSQASSNIRTDSRKAVELALETMLTSHYVIDDMTLALRKSNIVRNIGRGSKTTPTFLKRLLTMYISNKANVPYVPPTVEEIQKNIKVQR